MIFESMNESAKQAGDVVSIGALIGVIVRLLPTLASILTIVWIGLRIYESILNIRRARQMLEGRVDFGVERRNEAG